MRAGNRRANVGRGPMFLDFESLRLTSKPNQFLIAPKGLTQVTHEESPVFLVAADRLCDAFAAMIESQPRVEVRARSRSEEHTSELQSLMRISYAVFCLKKKKMKNTKI